jgi:phospholipase/lecithinase/hemolysin
MKIFFSAFLLFFSVVTSASSLNQMVVFGDSLSDNGNLYEFMKHQLPLSPPYFKGRFSNGPVWVELIMEHYFPGKGKEHLLDYAYGGAGVLSDDEDEDTLFTLRREIDSYFLTHENKAEENSLYVVWIGSNNYMAAPEEADAEVDKVIFGIQKGLELLAKNGAKHILVVNVPNLGRIPAARYAETIERLTYLSSRHNLILERKVEELKKRYQDIQWLYFNVNLVFDDMTIHPELYGFSNVTDTCYEELMDVNVSTDQKSVLKMVASIKLPMQADACTGFLFFDPVHPTDAAHELMASRSIALFAQEGVEFQDI